MARLSPQDESKRSWRHGWLLVPLILFCRNRRLMGSLVNRPVTTAAATAVSTVIIGLNVFLLEQTFFG